MKKREVLQWISTPGRQHCYHYGACFWMTLLLAAGLFMLWPPDVAEAHNCGDFRDCYSTLRAAVAATVGLSMFAVILSIGLDFVPGVGQAKGVMEAITGRDLITGEELDDHVRLLGILGPAGRIAGGVSAVSRGAGNINRGTSIVPTVKSGEFNNWFNTLSLDELDRLWVDKRTRKSIERQLRAPGGMHEWLLVSRAPTFKSWGITADQIRDLRTPISEVEFVNPPGRQ